jgi:hypothetical protein
MLKKKGQFQYDAKRCNYFRQIKEKGTVCKKQSRLFCNGYFIGAVLVHETTEKDCVSPTNKNSCTKLNELYAQPAAASAAICAAT